ncbi:hypothetical protein HBI82_242040 [Parastagonospora nodorum]|nr:hypothetical protein HBI82_242040 [Parastagonospora nodorum]
MLAKSSSIVSNRSIALITDKFSVALLTKPAILNNANIILVDAVHHSVINALTMTLIKDDDDLLGTVNSYIKLRRLRARCKTKAADSRHAKLGKKAQLKKTRDEEELAKAKKEKEEKELIDAYILYFKELLSNNGRIFANAIGIGKTRAIVLAVLIEHFCFFSNSPLENIGRLMKEEAIEMRINTTNAIFKALAAANKLIILEANTPAVHSKATKHFCGFRKVDKHVFRAYNTISVTAQRMIIRKGGPYIKKRAILLPSYFNATNKRDSVTSNRIYKIKDARFILKRILKTRDLWGKLISSIKSDFLDILEKEGLNKLEASRRVIFNCFEMQAIASYSALATLKAAYVKDLFTNLSKDYFLSIAAEDAAKAANILLPLKEVCAKILIGSYKPIVQAVTWLGLREKFGNESVLVMQGASMAFAEAIILIEATHVLAEMCVSIVYFNLDSELELKVLGKQDVKTTS